MIGNARDLARALGGEVAGRDSALVPGPGHSRHDRSLSIRLSAQAPDGFVVFSHADDAFEECRDYVRARLGLARRRDKASIFSPARKSSDIETKHERTAYALQLWGQAVPLPGTLGEFYFVEHRHIPIGDLDHVLRWHDGIGAIVGLMTDATTNIGTGVHRIFLTSDGRKVGRKMLGRQGIVRLSPDEDVTVGLGVTEGVEDALAVLSTWAPVWAATSAGAIARLPILAGIEALTLFADADAAGMTAAIVCAERWRLAGVEAEIAPPPQGGGR